MLRGLRWFALPAVVIAAALVVPTAALAGDCNGAAQSIYSEGCVQTAKGPSQPTHKAQPTQQTQTTTPIITPPPVTPPPVTPPAVHYSRGAKHALLVIARRLKALDSHLWKSTHVSTNTVDPVLASSPTNESSLGSAFDLGAGPMILFALLAGTVLVLLGTGGVRSWRNRHRV